jgi:hypothetical protein
MSDLGSAAGQSALNRRFAVDANVLMPLLWLAAAFALALPAIRGGIFNAMSTDDAMRLVQVRDLIGGQDWFDLSQHRLNPPGTSMHWSRVVDMPLAALILLLRPLIGTHGAEAVTLFLWPLLLLAAALVLVAAIARQMSDGVIPSQVAAAALAVLSTPALIHFRPGGIDHHNAQIGLLLALVLLTSQIEQSAVKAAMGGLAASLSLAIGIEMLPAIAAIGLSVFGLFIWRGASVSRQIAAFGAGLTASSLLFASIFVPSSLASPVCDAFGGPVLLLTAGGGTGLMIMAAIDRFHSTLRLRLVTGAVSAIALVGTFLSLFAGCIASPYAQLDPLVISLWVDNVSESISVATMLQLAPEKVPGFYGFPLMTMGFSLAALVQSSPHQRFRWIPGITTLAALIGLGFWEMRATAAATIVATPVFAASLASLWPTLPLRRLALLVVAASPASFAALGMSAKPAIDVIFKPQMAIAERDSSECRTVSDVAPMTRLPNGRAMAPIDLGPMILAETDHAVFAAPYHRNNDGNLALLRLLLAPLPAARQILSDRRVDYLLLCSAPDRDLIKLAPDGLAARLGRGETPDFLEPIDLDPAHKISVWRVRQ